MVANAQLATIQDLVASDADRLELLRGELIEMAPVSLRHFAIVGALQREFGAFVREHDLGIVGGEGGFVLGRNPDTLLAPDVGFIGKDRLPAIEDWDGFPELVPDLIIEVVSPSDRAIDVYDKTRVYLAAGVRMVLTVWPRNQTITVERPNSAPVTLGIRDEFNGSDVLPGFTLMLSKIFE